MGRRLGVVALHFVEDSPGLEAPSVPLTLARLGWGTCLESFSSGYLPPTGFRFSFGLFFFELLMLYPLTSYYEL